MHSGSTARGATIRILLLDGTPDGLRLISNSNWNGLVMMCSRPKYPAVRNRDEFTYPGVYFLYGPAQAEGGNVTLYIGQADNIRERLDTHHRSREFWTQLAVFTSMFGHLNRAHAQYLESRLIDLAQNARRAEVQNGNAPRLPYLSESDRYDSESFLDQILLLCPILGLDYFEGLTHSPHAHRPKPVPSQSPSQPVIDAKPAVSPTESVSGELFLAGPGARAVGRAIGRKLEVFTGSVAREQFAPSTDPRMIRRRDALVAEGVFARSAEGLVLTKNHVFDSPSAAAVAMLARPANGLTEWKDSQGRTLKSLQTMDGRGTVDVQ
jgi:hypothetical protein